MTPGPSPKRVALDAHITHKRKGDEDNPKHKSEGATTRKGRDKKDQRREHEGERRGVGDRRGRG